MGCKEHILFVDDEETLSNMGRLFREVLKSAVAYPFWATIY
jgi:hypothetical protein